MLKKQLKLPNKAIAEHKEKNRGAQIQKGAHWHNSLQAHKEFQV